MYASAPRVARKETHITPRREEILRSRRRRKFIYDETVVSPIFSSHFFAYFLYDEGGEAQSRGSLSEVGN